MAKRSRNNKLSKQQVAIACKGIYAIFDPVRRSVVDGTGKQTRVFRVRWHNKTLAFPSLQNIMTFVHDPDKYNPNAPDRPVDTIPADWIMDETNDPIKHDAYEVLNLPGGENEVL